MRIITVQAWLQTSTAVLRESVCSLLPMKEYHTVRASNLENKQENITLLQQHTQPYLNTRRWVDGQWTLEERAECRGHFEVPVEKVKDWLQTLQLKNWNSFIESQWFIFCCVHAFFIAMYFQTLHSVYLNVRDLHCQPAVEWYPRHL